jgi:tRNA G18 (ribose-2'-O)-methylase SpoU
VEAVVTVDDPSDARLADYVGLRDPELRRRVEAPGSGAGIFIGEGLTVLARLLDSPYPVRSILVTPARLPRVLPLLRDRQDVPTLVAQPAVVQAVAGFDLHRGVVASAARLPPCQPEELLARSRTIAVLEGLNDHENLGAIARSARALGVDGLLLDPTCADPLYRRSVRVSMGEILHLPFARAGHWPDTLDELHRAGWRVLALTPAAEATPIGLLQVDPSERVAVLLGAEGPGLSAPALARVIEQVRIPLRSPVDSLNVGHAAAIAFEHLGRA